MTIVLRPLRCYLAEWYGPEFGMDALADIVGKLDDCAGLMSAEGNQVRLLTLVAVPADEVVFGIFAANSEQLAARVCTRAGIPARRLSAAIDARINAPDCRETPDDSGRAARDL